MSEFEIEVEGKIYKGTLHTYGYSYKIVMDVAGRQVSFEPDEERNFRAIVPMESIDKINGGILKAIAAALEQHLQ